MTIDELIARLSELREDGEVQLRADVEVDGFDNFSIAVVKGTLCIDTELNLTDDDIMELDEDVAGQQLYEAESSLWPDTLRYDPESDDFPEL